MPMTHIPAAIELRGIRLVNLALQETLDAIDGAMAARLPTRIAFVNADCVNLAARYPAYRDHLTACDWVFVDGSGMRLAGKIMRQPVRDNVNGTDLFPLLCERLASQRQRLFLLGARPGVAAAAAEWAKARFPGLQIAGIRHGYYTPEEEVDVLAEIRASHADVLLVAFGAPRQEAWIAQHHADSGAIVAIGVGGLFDYYSGRIPRAPAWMRRCGIEWIFRLIQEPGRLWRRYLVGNAVFLWRVGLDRLMQVVHRNPRSNGEVI